MYHDRGGLHKKLASGGTDLKDLFGSTQYGVRDGGIMGGLRAA